MMSDYKKLILEYIKINKNKFKFYFLVPTILLAIFLWILMFFVKSPRVYSLPEKIYYGPVLGIYGGLMCFVVVFVCDFFSFCKSRKILDNDRIESSGKEDDE